MVVNAIHTKSDRFSVQRNATRSLLYSTRVSEGDFIRWITCFQDYLYFLLGSDHQQVHTGGTYTHILQTRSMPGAGQMRDETNAAFCGIWSKSKKIVNHRPDNAIACPDLDATPSLWSIFREGGR